MIGRPKRLSVGASLVWFGVSYGGAVLGYLLVNSFAARLLGDEFALFVVAVTASTVVGQLGLFGAHRGGLREAARLTPGDDAVLARLRRWVRAASWVTLPVTAALGGLATWALSGASTDRDAWALGVGTGVLAWLGGQQKLLANFLRGFGQVRVSSLMEGRSGGALAAVFQGFAVGMVLLTLPSLGLVGALGAMSIGLLVPVAAAWLLARRHWAHVPAGRLRFEDVRDVVFANRHFASNLLGGSLNSVLEIWLAGLLLSRLDASLFAASHRLALLLAISVMSLGVVFGPVVSRLQGRDDELLERLVRTGATLASLVTAVLWVPMLLAPGFLLEVVFGDPFRAGAPMLVLLTLGGVANVLTGLCAVALTMSRHEAVVARMQWVGVVARLALGTTGGLLWGGPGLALAAALVSVGMSVSLWRLSIGRLGLKTHPTLRPEPRLLRTVPG